MQVRYQGLRVRTGPGKVWKVLEFNIDILKVILIDIWKSLENSLKNVMLTSKMQMTITL